MNMRPDDKQLYALAPIKIRPYAELKQDKALAEARIRIREIDSASHALAEENPDLAAWFIIQVRTGRESSVESTLQEMQINSLVLREPESVVVRRGRKWVCPGRPWMPGFVLVRCVPSPSAFRGLLGARHVEAVVGGWAKPYKVKPESIMEFNTVMQEKEEERERKRLEQEAKNAAIKKGSRVRITLGPFTGFNAVVQTVGKGPTPRCELTYKLYGHQSRLTIPLANVEAL